jgi:hypothetical protein
VDLIPEQGAAVAVAAATEAAAVQVEAKDKNE